MASILKLDTLQTPSGTGVITSSNTIVSPGNVLQVQNAFDTTQYTYNTGSPSQTVFYDIPGLVITITPKSTTSRFYLSAHVSVSQAQDAYNVYLRFSRNGTAIASSVPGSGYISSGTATVGWRNSLAGASINALPMCYFDVNPGTGLSPITFKVQVCNSGGSSYASYINRANTTDASWQQAATSNFTVMEIAQ